MNQKHCQEQDGAALHRLNSIGEFGLIDRLAGQQNFHKTGVVQGIGDDTAVVEMPEGRQILLATDLLVEKTHFLRSTISPFQLGRKALAVNLSDIAAMGGRPEYFLVSLGVPASIDVAYIESIYQGLYDEARRWHTALVGGDTVASEQLAIGVTIVGSVARGRSLLRSTAQPGDTVCVTGWPGLSGAGFHWLTNGQDPDAFPSAIAAHTTPTPRLREIRWLTERAPIHSANDVSDGVGNEALEIATASRVDIILEEYLFRYHDELLSISKRLSLNPRDLFLFGGEDYELLLTMPDRPPTIAADLARRFVDDTGTPLHPIGYVMAGSGRVLLKQNDGHIVPLAAGGFQHFS